MSGLYEYNTIVVSPEPRGRFFEGIISGTPKPGTVMQVQAGTAKSNGRFTYEAYSRDADGDNPQGPITVLCEDSMQGRTVTTAYAANELARLYVPMHGDELLMLVADVAGTTLETWSVGDILIVDSGTGKLNPTTGTPENEHFVMLEAYGTGISADFLAHVMFVG